MGDRGLLIMPWGFGMRCRKKPSMFDYSNSEFSKLLANDPSDDVKSVAAANYGKVLTVLQRH